MKDIFIFEGKKYISAKRASEISDYSGDYVGQLCRAGKLDCRMVGRSWFVTEESMRGHHENVKVEKEATATVTEPVPLSTEKSLSAGLKDFKGKKYISARRASEISEYSADYIGQLCRAEKLDCRMVGRSWFVTEESIWRHQESIVEEEAGRDRIQNINGGKHADRTIRAAAVTPDRAAATAVADTESAGSSSDNAWLVRSIILRRVLLAGVLTCLIVVGVVGGAYFLNRPSGVATSQVATSQVAVESRDKTNSATPVAGQGVAIAPSSGTQSGDEETKQNIQATFSDQVNINPDLSGTAGVITPVFKEAKGKGFIYVMVPVKGASSVVPAKSVDSP